MKPGGMMVKKVNVEGLGNPVHGEYVRSEVWKLIERKNLESRNHGCYHMSSSFLPTISYLGEFLEPK